MKVGDLVTFGKRNGVIIEDRTMWCSHDVDEPYLMGAMMVLVEDQIKRVVYANLRLANESR
jgi:hypothetical protein